MTRKLTASEWRRISDYRIRGKRGEYLSPEELHLCERAMREDLTRYNEIGNDAFDATVPFGSNVKAKRR